MKRRVFLLVLGIVTATCFGAPQTLRADDAPGLALAKIKLLSCNIRLPVPEDEKTGDHWDTRKAYCAEVIAAQQADIICFQECRGVQLDYLRRMLSDFETYGLNNPEDVYNPVNAIAYQRSKFELATAGGFWLSEQPHVAGTQSWDSARPRFVNWVQLRDRQTQREFRVWNTHLDHIGHEARREGARLIVEAAAALPKDFPQILTGDLNADKSHGAIKIITERGWIDTYGAVHGPEDPGFTAHGFLGPKRAKRAKSGKIDWIFVRGPVKPLAAKVIRDGRDGHFPSDHYFVSAEVAL